MKRIKTVQDMASLTPEEAKEFLENYILIFITDEILLSCIKKEGSYIFRELNMAYDKKTKRCTGYDLQYLTVYKTSEQAMDELIHRANFLISFLKLNKPGVKIQGHVSKLQNAVPAQKPSNK